MRALTWNLFHGRDAPPDPELFTWRSRLLGRTERRGDYAQVNRPLRAAFAALIAAEAWDLALLQETPPRWVRPLAAAAGAAGASALTARNLGAAARAWLAERNPDLLASHEGGANALLVRPPWRIAEVRRLTVTRRPERRRLLWARLAGPRGAALCVGNLHASTHPPAAAREVERAAEQALAWAGASPLLFGGDLNLRPAADPHAFERLRARLGLAPPTDPQAIDHLLAHGAAVVEPPRRLGPAWREVDEAAATDGDPPAATARPGRRVRLSDHDAVAGRFCV